MTPRNARAPIVLTAGGTGGHVFPAEALATELEARGRALVLVTDRRGEGWGGTLGRLSIYCVPAAGVAGRGMAAKVGAAASLGFGLLKALALLARLRPSAVVGFGGYASLPATMAATVIGIPTVLHEQNAVLGRANRLLAPRVSRIATSHGRVEHLPAALSGKVTLTGMPVRDTVLAKRAAGYPALTADGPVHLLVLGGSQGARVLSEVIPPALARLPDPLRARVEVAQQCRAEDLELVRTTYQRAGIKARLETFFHDVPERLAESHLVICRAGASTVAELTALGRPSILVPYPHAIDDHQTANARSVDDAGGGWLMPQGGFSPESLAARLADLFAQPDTLIRAASCAAAAGRPDAGKRLADLVEAVADKKPEVPS